MADDHESPSSVEAAPVESLIQGRAKRSTAGLHMSALLDAAADDDLALLFEEVEDDNEFAIEADEEGGEEDDMRFESSSDDEDDQGPDSRADEMEGEQQLQKEERQERKKRRAQEDLRFKITSKKVKIDPTAVSAVPAPRPKKKSERISWIPTPEEGPTRSSSRRQTMQNKELTHARLKDSEEKRIRLIATMEEAAKRKAQFKPKEMTQAERLAEAERVERHNSKSLNRWEEMEKRKAEERLAKIEALQNRRLEGPVMSYWSGIATWVNGRLTRIGKVEVTPKPEKEDNARRKSKKMDKESKNVIEQKPTENAAAAGPATLQTAPPPTQTEDSTLPQTSGDGGLVKQNQEPGQQQQQQTISEPSQDNGAIPQDKPADTIVEAPASSHAPAEAAADPVQPSTSALNDGSGTEAAPDTASPKPEPEKIEGAVEAQATDAAPQEGTADERPGAQQPDETPTHAAEAQQSTLQVSGENSTIESEKQPDPPSAEVKSGEELTKSVPESPAATQPVSEAAATAPQQLSPTAAPDAADAPPPAALQETTPTSTQLRQEAPGIHVDQPAVSNEETSQPQVPEVPPVIEQTGRNLTVLENFDDKTAHSREFSIYFNAKKPARLTKISSSLCVITSLPSRYRDPETSLPFANSYAYNEIRHTVAQKYSWSPMLGCYIGPVGVAARGVPARFLGGAEAEEEPKEEEEEAKGEAKEGEQSDKNGGNEATTNKTESEPKAPSGDASTTSTSSPSAAAAPTPAAATAGDPMEIDT
ncbi:YL1-domain-containing protein [Aspergillus sclerotioniger CBS 115572]|uniref:YL1-domain-containing protein n=1 Tax=Aspergillus sclerotioniger CBS 115572 TaxID=1450535 RepID=A0A317V0S2_9EURO|nr:YL1-domain-containing protein [Aspergillus sclerotioniger CBS 115572]PWY67269.1 YL1-domain-containing protein [Aspergillus sclerotioniger CBS 115572]